MKNLDNCLPNIDSLHEGLSSILCNTTSRKHKINILNRTYNIYSSTFPSEVVTCQLENNEIINLLCKYSNGLNESYGHRGGVEYEVKIYSELLSKLKLSSVRYFGTYKDPNTKKTWLVLEYLDKSQRIGTSKNISTMINAASWIGSFHASCSQFIKSNDLSFINKYDVTYYKGWVDRTRIFTAELGINYKWLSKLYDQTDYVINILTSSPPTIIHGEYYPKNILINRNMIYPVDWESTAIGAGEIDIASLTSGWAMDDINEMIDEYHQTRNRNLSIKDLKKRILAARIYLSFRWLGDRPERTEVLESDFEYLEYLHEYTDEFLHIYKN